MSLNVGENLFGRVMTVKALALAWTCLLLAIPCSADIIYVKQGGTGSGTSWADGYGDLQDGLDDATGGDEIWVSAGTYYPTYDYGLGIGSRGKHFRMKNGVAIYGGFPDTGDSDIDDRDPNRYETILSGDIGTVSDNSDNCYHVFYHPSGTNLDTTAILDGFTITSGNAGDSSEPHNDGGGMYNDFSSPTVTNCTFTVNLAGWSGAGMYNDNSSSPIVTGCTFSGNSAVEYGGGIAIFSGTPTITNCTFSGNSASKGGGMSNYKSSLTVTNCTFSGNIAEERIPRGSVDINTRHQVIEGFGSNGAFYENWLYAHPKKSQIYDAMFGQLGLDIYRIRNVYHIDTPWNSWQELMSMNAEAVQRARESLGHPTKVIISAWTPPTYLKSNGEVASGTLARYPGGGYMYSEYAEWWADSILAYAGRGVTADYITIQNEPTWEAPYDSCKFKPTETTNWAGYNLALNAVYQELTRRMPSPPAILAPDTLSLWKAGPFIDAILDKSQVYGYAHHPYGDGNFDNPDSFIPGMQNFAATYNDKSIFQTEYCRLAGDDGFNEVMNLARHIHNSIVHEGVTAYFFWNLFSAASDVSKGLITIDNPWEPNPDYTINHRYYAFKQYSAFTDPGWQRVEASTDSSALRICAFISAEESELTVVIINVSDTTTDLALSLGDFFADSRKVYRTSATERTKYIGDFQASQLLVLPAESITTIVLTGAITNGFDTTNLALYNGGGIYNNQSSPTVTNCILWGNTPEQITQIHGSAVVTYSDVQGGCPGEGNIDANPLFVDPNGPDCILGTEDDNLRLLASSPCIDAGDNSVVDANVPDLDGNPRIVNAIVDMGAHEHQFPMALELDLSNTWMYQNVRDRILSNLTAEVLITNDPLNNTGYTYDWEFILPDDVTVAPTITVGGGPTDPCCTFAAPSCNEPDGLSDSGQALTVKVTVTGDDYGNTGTASAQFGIALLGDVNNNRRVNVTDRIIMNAYWRRGSAEPFTFRDCDIDCNGYVNVVDRIIANAIWRGKLGSGSVTTPCPFR